MIMVIPKERPESKPKNRPFIKSEPVLKLTRISPGREMSKTSIPALRPKSEKGGSNRRRDCGAPVRIEACRRIEGDDHSRDEVVMCDTQQIAIPVRLAEDAGWQDGDAIMVQHHEREIVLEKVRTEQ